MTLRKLLLVPDQNNYSVQEPDTVVDVKLAGGASRMRRDFIGAAMKVDVQFTVNPQDYQYLRAFYNVINKGADLFLMDLIIESPGLREYAVRIVPATWKLARVDGLAYQVKMSLEVSPNDSGLNYASIVSGYTPEPYVPPPPPTDFGSS